MFLLNFLPDFLMHLIVNLILLLGIIGITATTAFKYVIKYFPQLIAYRTIVQVVSIVLLVVGVYLKGGAAVEQKWRDRVAELEVQVKASEEKAAMYNEKLQSVHNEKVRVIKETQVVVQEKIKNVEVKIDSQCKISADTVDILNNAARGTKK